MVGIVRLVGDKIPPDNLRGSERAMHANTVRAPNSGRHDTRFIMMFKGAAGVSFLLIAVTGTVHGWLGHTGSSDPLLNPAAIVGAIIGAAAGYLCGRKPH
jgi:hypothetical protein